VPSKGEGAGGRAATSLNELSRHDGPAIPGEVAAFFPSAAESLSEAASRHSDTDGSGPGPCSTRGRAQDCGLIRGPFAASQPQVGATPAATAAAARRAGFANAIRRHTECADAQRSADVLYSHFWRHDSPDAPTQACLLYDDASFSFCANSRATHSRSVLRASSGTSIA